MACTFIGAKLRKKLDLCSLKKDRAIKIPKFPLPMQRSKHFTNVLEAGDAAD